MMLLNIAAAFQQAVVDLLVKKSILAVEKTGFDKLVIAGGVSANKYLRQQLQENLPKKNQTLLSRNRILH